MKNFVSKNSMILLIIIGLIVVVSYFLDKDLSKVLGITGFFVWFLREYSKQLFVKDLEKFKVELQKEAIQFKIRYEKLHTERAEVIKEVYKKIVKTYRAFHSYICPLQLAGEPTEEEKKKIAADEINSLVNFYEENRIFFNEQIAKEIDNLLVKFREAWNKFHLAKDLKKEGQSHIKEWGEAWDKVDKDISKVKSLIENKFRDIIGINNNHDSN